MKALLFPVILGVSAFGGVMVADIVRPSAPASTDDHDAKGDAHGKASKDSHGKGDKGGHGDAAAYAGDTEFLKFKRQFVVPVLKNDTVHALVLLNIGLEVSAKERDHLFRMEPRFRDAFIRELLALSDTGYLDGDLTSPDTYEVLRETLIRAAHEIAKEGIKDVLILDLSRQDR
ncbi:MAG: flagellar basal body-associated FliL family protein [Pseudomonadota bacterium]